MPKYHIGTNGPGACRARVRVCPLGGESGTDNHFDSKDEAAAVHQKMLSEEHGLLKTSKKLPEDSDSELLAPIEIAIPKAVQPPLEFMKTLHDQNFAWEMEDFLTTVHSGEVPQMLPSNLVDYGESRNSLESMLISRYMQTCGMYGKIMKDTATDIASNVGDGIVLDPMAGNGWAAKALREAGVKTIASDDNSWEISKDVENLDALESLRKYGDKISHLLISWAPYGSDMDVKLLREVRANYPHVTIINVGESEGGCTGSSEFWEEFETAYPQHSVRYETTIGLHDQVTFGK